MTLALSHARTQEENRLRAKALRAQRDATQAPAQAQSNDHTTGSKRPYSATLTASTTTTYRDARNDSKDTTANGATGSGAAHASIEPARKLHNKTYIEYDFSRMTDTKGGFLSADDDPHNRTLHAHPSAQTTDERHKPAHMSLEEWERQIRLKKLREARAGPFEPGISALSAREKERGCQECGSLEVDFNWVDIFRLRVCAGCKDKLPEKYSLLTKTEAKNDYLLTDPELRDPELLPRMEKPNPYKKNWMPMMLFLRCQVEAYAFQRKWGSEDKMDEEWKRREEAKKRKKDDKFRGKLRELKRRTRVEAFKRESERDRAQEKGGGDDVEEVNFGDKIIGRGDRHEHEWGRTLTDKEGNSFKKCASCGMQVEELEF